ncbi:MAG: DUF1707 domain-containing protein [Propionibacterium sp.]|jgi:hypothetical protein|nr:DUF1707 domain-containing protein [Propionibacterium sp.]MBB1575919.1 DUF1707 domain-containing protein [Propionibacterium sp.]MDO4645667.1 DUF1707 domain-containing protein [Propionibacteriaceae bacterium]
MSDSLPEQPAQVRMRIGDAERDSVLEVLRDAYAAGQLDNEEFNDRQQMCLKARYSDDLSGLVEDLPIGTGAGPNAIAPVSAPAAPVFALSGEEITEFAFMSGKVIHLDRGRPTLVSKAFWGGNEIYVENAMGPGVEVELTLSSIMGGHVVYVPPGVRVIDQSTSIMAGVAISRKAHGDGSNGTVIIRGFNFWGGTTVKLQKPQ